MQIFKDIKRFSGRIKENREISQKKTIIYNQIIKYKEFQEKIELFFTKGYTSSKTFEKETWYLIDSHWINKWKLYTNYDKFIKNQDKDINYLIEKNIIQMNTLYKLNDLNSDYCFLSDSLLETKDFECLINQPILDLFIQSFAPFKAFTFLLDKFKNNNNIIKARLYEKMLALLIEKVNCS